jgi:transcriptional regulator with XRE-family HTH domain
MELPELPDDRSHVQNAANLLREAAEADEPADLIAEARSLLKWTRAELGEVLDLSVGYFEQESSSGKKVTTTQCTTLKQWEHGNTIPKFSNRKKLRALADRLSNN